MDCRCSVVSPSFRDRSGKAAQGPTKSHTIANVDDDVVIDLVIEVAVSVSLDASAAARAVVSTTVNATFDTSSAHT